MILRKDAKTYTDYNAEKVNLKFPAEHVFD